MNDAGNARMMFAHWDEVRRGLFAALDKFNDEHLTFVPHEGLRPLGEIALHIASSERGWFRYVVQAEYDHWPSPYELQDYPTLAEVKRVLSEEHNRTNAFLETVGADELNRVVERPGREGTLTLRWVIWHVLEHEIHHRGEIFLMLGLLGIEAPRI
jgi:uncharacterized damage-inducible protein DinB